ncbi:MAG: hypothetical protein K2K81_09965 [Muribaculaceae bacterium]|nr:hypothetical protein [Muribaculaceae bacterium]
MKFRKIYIALSLTLLLPSCKSDEPAPVAYEEINMPISFTIRLASEDGTRAGEDAEKADGSFWDTDNDGNENAGTDDGTKFDNTINSITPVLYYVVDGVMQTNYPVAVMRDYEWMQEIDKETKKPTGQFTVTGVLRSDGWTADMLTDPKYSYRLALFINCGDDDVMSPLSISNPAIATFNHHGVPDDKIDAGSKNFHGIPMYGVSDVKFIVENKVENGEEKKEYKVTDSNGSELNIPILRSMAKVRVLLDKDKLAGKKVALQELYISRHAVKGYVVPKGWNRYSSVISLSNNGMSMYAFTGGLASTEDNGYYNHDCFVEPQEELDEDHLHFGQTDYYSNSVEKLRFYLPDTYNHKNDGDDSSKEIYLRIKYTVGGIKDANGKDKVFTHYLWFRPLSQWPDSELDEDGEMQYPSDSQPNPWDIIRNHIYEFIITGVEADNKIKVEVCVKPWNYKVFTTEL